MKALRFILSMCCVSVLMSCSATTETDIEKAEFHLDKAEFSEAIAILEPIYEADNSNLLAASRLATAYLGRGFYGNESALGIFANFLEGQASGLSPLESIREITPAAAEEGEEDIFAGDDILAAIDEELKTEENYLTHGFIHLAIISIVGVAKIGGLGSDDPCDYDFDAVNDSEENRFRNSLDEVNVSFTDAGIDDFDSSPLGELFTEIGNDLDAADNLQDFLRDEYDADACP